MSDDDRDGGSALPWFLLGLGLGAGIALLLAPGTGEETREALKRRFKVLREGATERLEDAREAVADGMETLRDVVGAGDDEDAGEAESGGVRADLERRLAAARARRRAAGTTAPRDADAEAEEPIA
jgi:gas vesicle protein